MWSEFFEAVAVIAVIVATICIPFVFIARALRRGQKSGRLSGSLARLGCVGGGIARIR